VSSEDAFDHPEQILSWLSERAGELYLKQIKDWKEQATNELLKSTKPEDMYRCQGRVDAYRNVLNIEEMCRALIEDKKAGRRN
jgi:hypothetical protein